MKPATSTDIQPTSTPRYAGAIARRLLPRELGPLFPAAAAFAQADPATSAILELHLQGQYENAATRGLNHLLVKPWHHQLRFVVADLPLYKEVLAADPANESANEGQILATLELRSRTSINMGKLEDSSTIQRQSGAVTHRFRHGKGPNAVELEIGKVRDTSPALETREKTFTGRYTANTLSLKPTLSLGGSNTGTNRGFYGGVSIRAGEHEDVIELDKVNWAVLATNPLAVQSNLSATHIGLQGTRSTCYGSLTAEWDSPDAVFYASGQVGDSIYGEAGRSWSLSAGGKYWLASDLSAGFSLWSMASRRNGAPYRAKSANVILEKFW
jgi:hypothetical protein